MKAVVLNDTSDYHKGCEKVMQYLHKDLERCGYEILVSVKGGKRNINKVQHLLLEADAVIVNGEGTMHHNALGAHDLLEFLKHARNNGKKTALVNSVWQSMTINDQVKSVLRDSYISVREIRSQKELAKDGIESDIHLDLSYFNDVAEIRLPESELIIGRFCLQKDYRPHGIPYLDIFQDDWDTVVNTLRSAGWFVTGRHHEMYAACKARCRFAVLDGNTHKNIGLIETAGVNIPVEHPHLVHSRISVFLDQCKAHAEEYEKLFDWMECQPQFTFADKF